MFIFHPVLFILQSLSFRIMVSCDQIMIKGNMVKFRQVFCKSMQLIISSFPLLLRMKRYTYEEIGFLILEIQPVGYPFRKDFPYFFSASVFQFVDDLSAHTVFFELHQGISIFYRKQQLASFFQNIFIEKIKMRKVNLIKTKMT